jgi:hypothetical protein
MMRDQVQERDNLKWPQRGGTKLPNAGTATFTQDTGMVDFTENPNACPLYATRVGLNLSLVDGHVSKQCVALQAGTLQGMGLDWT